MPKKQLLGTGYIIWHKVSAVWPFGKIGFVLTTKKSEKVGLKLKEKDLRSSPGVQWLGPCYSTAGGMGVIPRWGPKIP